MQNFQLFKSLSVLYAEDESELREVTEKTLRLLVGRVFSVSDGMEALSIYENNPVDVIILDIYMGSLSGIEVAQRIRKHNTKIPIIILSGSVQTEDLLAACKLNLVDYIQKPIELNTLIGVLSTTIDQMRSNGLLVARINDSVTYDYLAKSLIKEGETVSLTKNEIIVLELLLSRRGQVVTYETFSHLFDEEISDGALKNLILRIRKKIGDESALRNLAKVGYTLS